MGTQVHDALERFDQCRREHAEAQAARTGREEQIASNRALFEDLRTEHRMATIPQTMDLFPADQIIERGGQRVHKKYTLGEDLSPQVIEKVIG